MRRTAQLVSGLALSLLMAGNVMALPQPQEQEKQEKAAQAEKSGEMPKEQKPKVDSTTNDDEDKDTPVTLPHSVKGLGGRFLLDQKQIWTSPAHLRWQDANWLLPLSGVTAGLFVTDAQMSRHISHNPTTVSHYDTISNASVAGLLGGAGAMWLLSYPKHDQHWRETGFLAGEAVINSLVVVEAMKYPLGRQRPNEGNGNGDFFQGGVSFPSEHAAAAWAVAGVVAHEYPGPLTKIVVYSLATLVDYSRYRARQHFPSDVLIGSVIGNLVAEDVYSRHHDLELGGAAWNSFRSYLRQTHATSSANMGSPYVPLDSWVYPAMDRLIAQGFIKSAIVDMRPWTRFECARLVTEAGEQLEDADRSSSQAARVYDSLAQEFKDETGLMAGGDNTRAKMESAYTRFTGISGEPLSQGYHYNFGQTVINDFGRPYEEGFNNVTGFSGWATESRFVLYASGEFQHAPSASSLTASARQVIGQIQELPPPPATPISQIDHFQLLDTYVGMTIENWQLTFGKQSLWWGPGAGGPMSFSDNALPITMFRVDRVSPFKLPSVLGLMGPMRLEFFLGQLSGQNFIFRNDAVVGSWTSPLSQQPMISGERFSFKPTPNVEFGFSLTTLFAGQGQPFTMHTYLRSIFSAGNTLPGDPNKPGDRRSAFDLSYRLPLLRNWATFYADGFSEDQFSPVAYWDRSAWTGGLYISHFPKVPKLDLRMEGVYTDLPAGGAIGPGFWYWDATWRDGFQNEGNLMGSWIGRGGQGAQAWSNYWLSPKNRIQLNFRHEKISHDFQFGSIPGGGSLTDLGIMTDYWVRPTLGLSASVQYERWLIPVIQANESRNVAVTFGISLQPQKLFKRSSAVESHSGKEGDSGF
jgi:membrane-associated phospholipid phosphatase